MQSTNTKYNTHITIDLDIIVVAHSSAKIDKSTRNVVLKTTWNGAQIKWTNRRDSLLTRNEINGLYTWLAYTRTFTVAYHVCDCGAKHCRTCCFLELCCRSM